MIERPGRVREQAEQSDVDAFLYLGYAHDTNLEYIGGTNIPDVGVYCYHRGDHHLLCPAIEYGRIQKESILDSVISFGNYVDGDARGDWEKYETVIASFLDDRGIDTVTVPPPFPHTVAAALTQAGIDIDVGTNILEEARLRKAPDELERLEEAQNRTESLMEQVETILKEARIDGETLLYEGATLTSKRLKTILRKELLDDGFQMDTSIIACGQDGADPHGRGSGPLKTGEPIIVDLFPQAPSGYWGDMTRTFFKDEAGERARSMYKAVLKAQKDAIDVIGEGVDGSSVHQAAKEVFADHGFETTETEGFLHRTGHGIGRELHERPSINEECGPLEEGMVLTIEPALYYRDTGGVRIEDMVIVTKDGCRNLNTYEKDLTIC